MSSSTPFIVWWVAAAAAGVWAGERAVGGRPARRKRYYGLVGVAVAACGILASFAFSNSHPFSGGEGWSERGVVGVMGVFAGGLTSVTFSLSRAFFSRRRHYRVH